MALDYKVRLSLPTGDEIRCIQVVGLCQYDLTYLRERIAVSFSLPNHQDFSLYWIDEEGDKIKLTSNDDLIVVVNRRTFNPVKKLFVTLKEPQDDVTCKINNSATLDHLMSVLKSSRPIHSGVHCDGCQLNPLVGFRYKCLVCPDYDLCMDCEKSGNIHSHHPMVRIPAPLNCENLFEK